MRHQIHLVPVGDVEAGVLEEIEKNLEKAFNIPVKKEASIPVPNDTFVPFREQYHSPTILDRIRIFYPLKLGFAIVLAIIDRDIFVPDLNFVFGEADSMARSAIISLFRLHPEFYGLAPDEETFRGRAVKEATHEVGHVLGLTHCPDPSCIMYFSNRLEDTDMKGPDFCQAHRDRLGKVLGKL